MNLDHVPGNLNSPRSGRYIYLWLLLTQRNNHIPAERYGRPLRPSNTQEREEGERTVSPLASIPGSGDRYRAAAVAPPLFLPLPSPSTLLLLGPMAITSTTTITITTVAITSGSGSSSSSLHPGPQPSQLGLDLALLPREVCPLLLQHGDLVVYGGLFDFLLFLIIVGIVV